MIRVERIIFKGCTDKLEYFYKNGVRKSLEII